MKARPQSGFTLIEMMVVIVIIGILAAITVTVLSGRADKAKVEGTKALITQIDGALEQFRLNHNKYPEKLEDLRIMPSWVDPKSWPLGGYVKKDLKDAWGNDFVYRVPGTGGYPYDLISLGADGREGGEGYDADLWNHDVGKK